MGMHFVSARGAVGRLLCAARRPLRQRHLRVPGRRQLRHPVRRAAVSSRLPGRLELQRRVCQRRVHVPGTGELHVRVRGTAMPRALRGREPALRRQLCQRRVQLRPRQHLRVHVRRPAVSRPLRGRVELHAVVPQRCQR